MVFHWSSSDSKFPQVFRTLLSILAVFNNAVVWMVSTHLPTSKSSNPFKIPLVTVLKAPITIGICHLHVPSKVMVLILLFTFFQLYSVVNSFANSLFFFFCWLLLSPIFWSRLGDPCVCQRSIGVYVCHFLGQMLGCTYTICSNGQM